MSRPFLARFPGWCAAQCGDGIRAGDEVAYIGEDLVHADCATETIAALDRLDAANRREPAPCTSCHLVHAGECW